MNDNLPEMVMGLKASPKVIHEDPGSLIYERFYLAARESGIVWTLTDLARRDGLFSGPDEEFSPDAIPGYREHGQAIEHVMQMEVTIFVFRRMNGPWGEVIDGMLMNRNRFSNEYRERTGYQIDTGQDEKVFS